MVSRIHWTDSLSDFKWISRVTRKHHPRLRNLSVSLSTFLVLEYETGEMTFLIFYDYYDKESYTPLPVKVSDKF